MAQYIGIAYVLAELLVNLFLRGDRDESAIIAALLRVSGSTSRAAPNTSCGDVGLGAVLRAGA
jgi:hypothetical protein